VGGRVGGESVPRARILHPLGHPSAHTTRHGVPCRAGGRGRGGRAAGLDVGYDRRRSSGVCSWMNRKRSRLFAWRAAHAGRYPSRTSTTRTGAIVARATISPAAPRGPVTSCVRPCTRVSGPKRVRPGTPTWAASSPGATPTPLACRALTASWRPARRAPARSSPDGFEALLTEHQPDVVIVTLPDAAHHEDATAALAQEICGPSLMS
jgi:hypothetical protein